MRRLQALSIKAVIWSMIAGSSTVNAYSPQAHSVLPESGEVNGVKYFLGYWNDVQYNPIGGREKEVANAGALYGYLEADLYRVAGLWRGLSLLVSASWWTGQNLSESIGNEFTASAWFAPTTWYLDELYLKQNFRWCDTEVRLGRLMAEFNFASSILFFNYVSLGIDSNPVSVYFNTLFPADPFGLWGGYLKVSPRDDIVVKGAIFSQNPNILDKSYHGFYWSFQGARSAMLIGQVEVYPEVGGLEGIYRVGAYYTTGKEPMFEGGVKRGNYSFYTVIEQDIWRCNKRKITAWGTGMVARGDRNRIPRFLSFGLVGTGLIRFRPNDLANFGFAWGDFSKDLAREQEIAAQLGIPGQFGNEPQSYEALMELNYWIQVRPKVFITPLLQWIINPGATGNLPDALVVGIQLSATL